MDGCHSAAVLGKQAGADQCRNGRNHEKGERAGNSCDPEASQSPRVPNGVQQDGFGRDPMKLLHVTAGHRSHKPVLREQGHGTEKNGDTGVATDAFVPQPFI